MLQVSVTELVRNFREYMNRVVYRGERFLLTRGRKPVAVLGPVARGRALGELPDLLGSLPRLSPGDATRFEDDWREAQSELSNLHLEDAWES